MNSSEPDHGFLPETPERNAAESVIVRVIATIGILGLGTALGAGMVAADTAGWITGFAVSFLSVLLAAVLWRSRRL